MNGISNVPLELNDNSDRSWEKQSRKNFVWRMTLFSGIGGAVGGILFLGAGIFAFLNIVGDAPPPVNYATPIHVVLESILALTTLFSIALGLPIGLFQWFALRTNLIKSLSVGWIFIYSLGLFPSIFVGSLILDYWRQDIISLIIFCILLGLLVGLLQWLILRKLIFRKDRLLYFNILGMSFLVLGFIGALALNQWLYLFGFIVGESFAGAIYGCILALMIISHLRKDVALRM